MQTVGFNKTGSVVTCVATGDKEFTASEYPQKFRFSYDGMGNVIITCETNVNQNLFCVAKITDVWFGGVAATTFDDIEIKIQQMFFAADDSLMNAFRSLGSTIKTFPIGYSPTNIASNQTLPDNNIWMVATEVKRTEIFTGVKWHQGVQGNYTADQYNGVGLYKISSAGVLSLVASSTNDGNIWKATAFAYSSKAFSAPYTADAGIYFIAALYNNSAEVTAPQIGSLGTSGTVWYTLVDFTNSYKLHSILAAQNSLPSSITTSATTGLGSKIGLFLY